jgi:hypothetical protein
LKLHLTYIWEKLMVSISTLADGDGEIKHRLADAYMSQLLQLEDSPSMPLDLPEHLAGELREVLRRLGDAYQAGPAKDPMGGFTFDNEEAREIVGKILSSYDSVCRMMGRIEGVSER